MHAPTLENTSLLVLCGGAGTRMAGQDKPLLEWQGAAMVDRVLASVPADMPKIISANRNLTAYRRRGAVVTDPDSEDSKPGGPLVGVLAGLSACASEWLLVAPGDVPQLPELWWQDMFAAAGGGATVVAHDGQRQQHLHMLLHRSVSDHLQHYLSRGRYEVYRWLEELKPAVARFDDPAAFANINTPGDLA